MTCAAGIANVFIEAPLPGSYAKMFCADKVLCIGFQLLPSIVFVLLVFKSSF